MLLENYPDITLIFRNTPSKLIHFVCETIIDEKFDFALELTMNSSNIDELSNFILTYPELKIGAGTVLNLDSARMAIACGAQFLLSPTVMPDDVISFSKQSSVFIVSGAFTPSEIWSAYQKGSDIVKVFPARDLPMSYVKDIQAPLGNVPLMAVGGVSPSNMQSFFDIGFQYVGIGSSLFGNNSDVTKENVYIRLTELNSLLIRYL